MARMPSSRQYRAAARSRDKSERRQAKQPPCVRCGEIVPYPHERCGPCALAHFYEVEVADGAIAPIDAETPTV